MNFLVRELNRTYLTRKIECGFKDLKFYGLLMVTRILSIFIVVLLKDIERILSQSFKIFMEVGVQVQEIANSLIAYY